MDHRVLCYLGDTNIKVFEVNKYLLQVPVIIVECTIPYSDLLSPLDVYDQGHIHWDHLKPYVKENPHTFFILIHFSRQYTDQDIVQYIVLNGLPNVLLWLDSGPLHLAKYFGSK